MTQKLKRFQCNMENSKLFCTAVTIFSMLFPCMNVLFFSFLIDLSMYHFLFIGFYSVIGNIILFRKNKILRTALIVINIACMFIWYYVSLMGYWHGLFMSICCSIIPFWLCFL